MDRNSPLEKKRTTTRILNTVVGLIGIIWLIIAFSLPFPNSQFKSIFIGFRIFLVIILRITYPFFSKLLEITTWNSIEKDIIHRSDTREEYQEIKKEVSKIIPERLYEPYDTIITNNIGTEKIIDEFNFHSEFIHTKTTINWKNRRTYDSNKALYLIYTRTEQFPFMQSYLHITADSNDSIKAQILKWTIGPLVTFWWLLYIIEDWFFEVLEMLSNAISVNQRVIICMITTMSSFIGALVRKWFHNKNTVILENKQIEKLIDVKSNDPIFARQICNPQFIETLHSTLEKEKLWWWTEVYIDTKQQKVFIKIDYLQKWFSLWSVDKFLSLHYLSNFTTWNDVEEPKTEEIDKREGIFSQLLKSLKLTHAMRIISTAASITQDHTQIENNPLPIDAQQSLKIWRIIKRLIIAWGILYLLSISPYLSHFLQTGDLSYRNGSFEIPSSNANPIQNWRGEIIEYSKCTLNS